jgi:hypothetical protein
MNASSVSVLPPFVQPITRTPVPSYENADAWSGRKPFDRAVMFTIATSRGTCRVPDSQTISQRSPMPSNATWTAVRALPFPRST